MLVFTEMSVHTCMWFVSVLCFVEKKIKQTWLQVGARTLYYFRHYTGHPSFPSLLWALSIYSRSSQLVSQLLPEFLHYFNIFIFIYASPVPPSRHYTQQMSPIFTHSWNKLQISIFRNVMYQQVINNYDSTKCLSWIELQNFVHCSGSLYMVWWRERATCQKKPQVFIRVGP